MAVADKTIEEKVQEVGKLGIQTFGENGPAMFSLEMYRDTRYVENNSMRQWTYMVCNEMGYLFTPTENSALTSSVLGIDYWVDLCRRVFGVEMQPKIGIDALNLQNAGLKPVASNIVFTNGKEDGWRWAGINQIDRPLSSMWALINECEDCGHCQELHAEKDDDAEILKTNRKIIRKHVATWLKGDGFPEECAYNKRLSLLQLVNA